MFQVAPTQKLILISGPGGSGKTSLAKWIGDACGYTVVSEDDYWREFKANDPQNGLRTLEEERIIQRRVAAEVRRLLIEGKQVVLEFILYCDPPRPLLAYREALKGTVSDLLVVLLRPSVDAILARKKRRGREQEQDAAAEAAIALSQLNCLDSPHIKKEWIVPNSDRAVSETLDWLARENPGFFA
ncbi:AAA family ATPase [Paenibacillus sp. MWE-103]|uniref:AAA family ATPase n=1 Tax=Paenibacillus artemisiicola TaxID=1172618 RepID=A0ABS3W4Y0_9BACL|nr:AAA family ATPase [Paenibacillus artemisiicola]MBO7743356.1 AAA family ATPase [Paenibacillus artemisiicola]